LRVSHTRRKTVAQSWRKKKKESLLWWEPGDGGQIGTEKYNELLEKALEGWTVQNKLESVEKIGRGSIANTACRRGSIEMCEKEIEEETKRKVKGKGRSLWGCRREQEEPGGGERLEQV